MASQETNIDRLLKARAELDEELRRHKTSLTILFTDLVGSTAYFDRHGDTAGLALLQRHRELADHAVAEFRGTVIKTIGDSVMAEFSEPAFAVRAAVELQRRLLRLNQTLPERERVQLRIGINHGLVFRRGSDVYGDAVNLAARITKRTGPAQILISRSAREAITLEHDLRCTWLGKITFEGKIEKEDIFEVIWTDTDTYTDLRQQVTTAFARGELVSPGIHLDDFLQPAPPDTPVPSEPPKPAILSPTALTARYDILGEAGSGGMGVVYKARDRETGELVALKVLKPEIATDQVVMERFKNELRLARKITHKNVCRIHEFNRTDGTAYISMEFVEGESLRRVLNRFGTLSVRKGVEVARQICSGLREAHAQGIVHRDLKPENVILDSAGNVKVMDFGIARSVETSTTTTGSVLGTPAYMAPEQAEGKAVDARTDIYALGLVLYEMFTGAPAFSGDTPVAVALKQIREAPRPPRELEATLPAYIEKAILKCLEKDRVNRFPSVDELEAALTRKPEAEHAVAPREGEVEAGAKHLFQAGRDAEPPPAPAPAPQEVRPAKPPEAQPLPSPQPAISPPTLAPGVLVEAPGRWRRRYWLVVAVVIGGIALAVSLTFDFFPTRQPTAPATTTGPAQAPPEKLGEPREPEPAPQPAGAVATKAEPTRQAAVPAVGTLTTAQDREIRAQFNRARRAVQEGRSQDAIAAFEAILALDPKNEAAAAGLARERRRGEEVEREQQQRQTQVSELLAQAEKSSEKGDHAAAIAAYEAVLALDPNNRQAQEGLRRAQQAAAEAEVMKKQRQVADLLARGLQALEKGDYDAAIKAYQEALALDPNNKRAQEGLTRANKAKAAEEKVRQRLKKPE